DAGQLGETGHVGVAIDRRYERCDALRHDGTIVPVAHERATETRVVHDREVRAELHARGLGDRLFDLTKARLIAHDLARDIAEAQLVQPCLAHRRVADPALPLDEVARVGPFAALHRLRRAARDTNRRRSPPRAGPSPASADAAATRARPRCRREDPGAGSAASGTRPRATCRSV